MRRPVIEIECGRCHRTEHLEPPTVSNPEPADAIPVFAARLADVHVRYDDLCTNCLGIVQEFFNKFRPLTKKSPVRKKDVGPPTPEDLGLPRTPLKKPTSETKGPIGPGVSPATPLRAPRG